MLNTKPIKKNRNTYKYENYIPNLSSDTKQNTNQSEKIVNIESSKQKELENVVKQANQDNLENNQDNSKNESLLGTDNQMKNQIIYKEFTNDMYKDKNLNITGIIDGNKILNNQDQNLINFQYNNPQINNPQINNPQINNHIQVNNKVNSSNNKIRNINIKLINKNNMYLFVLFIFKNLKIYFIF